jgi:hypothetical protein
MRSERDVTLFVDSHCLYRNRDEVSPTYSRIKFARHARQGPISWLYRKTSHAMCLMRR